MRTLIFAAISAACLSAAAATPLVTFDGSDNAGISFGNNAVATYANGHASVEMGVQSTDKWRADIIFKTPTGAENPTFNPANDKIFAIKFIGARPQGNLTLEVKNGGTTYSKSNTPSGTITSLGGNTIVYYDLSTMGGYADAGEFASSQWQLKVADNTAEPHAYTLDWIKVYPSVEALEADKNWKDDGDSDADDKGAITNLTTSEEFATLKEAFDAAKASSGPQELLINTNISVSAREEVPENITITGANPDICITRTFNGILFLVKKNSTFKNITLDGNNLSNNTVFLEVSNSATITFDNASIQNLSSTHNQGIICLKGGGKMVASNLKLTNCTTTAEGSVFYGSNCNVTISDNIQGVSFFIEKSNGKINVGSNLNVGDAPINITYTATDIPAEGTVVVNGTRDDKLFNLANETENDLTLLPAPNGDNALVISAPREPVITSVKSGTVFYSLAEALTAPIEGDTLLLNENIEINSRITLGTPLTFKGAKPGISIKRTFNGIMMLVNSHTTFADLTLTSNEPEIEFVYLEVNKSNLTLQNVTLENINSKKDQGIIALKQGSHLIASDIEFVNCSSTNQNCPGFIFFGTNGAVALSDSIKNASVTIENKNAAVAAGENLAVNVPIALSFRQAPELGAVVVNGTNDASLFSLVGLDGCMLDALDNSLIVAEPVVENVTTSTIFTSLEKAFAAIAADEPEQVQELVVKKSLSIGNRLTVPAPVKIAGATPDVKITSASDNIMMLVNADATFADITLAAKADTLAKVLLEANGSKLTFQNVKFDSINSKAPQGIVALKQASTMVADGVDFNACSAVNANGPAFVFVGKNSHIALNAIDAPISIAVENNSAKVSADADFNPAEGAVSLFFQTLPADGDTIVYGTANTAPFVLANADNFLMMPADGCITVAKVTVIDKANGAKYASIEAAFAAIKDESEAAEHELEILANITISSTLEVPAAMEIAGTDTINAPFSGAIMSIGMATTISGITFAGAEAENSFFDITADKATFDDVTFVNCKGGIRVAKGAQVALANEISGAEITLQPQALPIAASALSVDKPVIITLADSAQWADGTVLVQGTSDAALFALAGMEGYSIKASDDAADTLILVAPVLDGISSLSADNADVRYYDVNGRIVANPVKGNIYIEVRGSKASKVLF